MTSEAAAAPAISQPAVLAKAGAENFPVASRLLPKAQRRHLLAVYGFARLVDDIGDESDGDRLAELAWAEAELNLAFAGRATSAVFCTLQETLAEVDLPRQPFADLIEANRRDQLVGLYPTYEELLGYCALSANPVGRLVLGIFGAASGEAVRLSDRICTGLQLVEHWQDVREDARRDRIYLPSEDLDRFGVDAALLRDGATTPAFRRLMAFEVGRARGLLGDGAPLVGLLKGRPRVAVAGFVAGGRAALDAIEAAGYDVLEQSPRPGRAGVIAGTARLLGRGS